MNILINFLLVAFAIDFPKDVFPTPGGPTNTKLGPFIFCIFFEQLKIQLFSLLLFQDHNGPHLIFFVRYFRSVFIFDLFDQGNSVIQSK